MDFTEAGIAFTEVTEGTGTTMQQGHRLVPLLHGRISDY